MEFLKNKNFLIGLGIVLVLVALFVQIKLFMGSDNPAATYIHENQGAFNAIEASRTEDGRIRISLAYPVITEDNQIADKIAVYYDIAKPKEVPYAATFLSEDSKGMIFWLPATYGNTGWHANFFHGANHDAKDAKFFLKPERWTQPGYSVRGLTVRRGPGGFGFFADVQ